MPGMSTAYNYRETTQSGEIQNYVRQDLSAQSAAKSADCQTLLSHMRTDRTICFSLHTALELYAIERPRRCTLPASDFYITTRDHRHRSTMNNVLYRTWNQPFAICTLTNGLTCVHPLDTWIQYAQYLDLDELVVLGEAIARRFRYSVDQFRNRLAAFQRIVGRLRCEKALELLRTSDSVQETRARLALLRFGLPSPGMHHVITGANGNVGYTVDMAYPASKVCIEYDGDHHRRFRSQYVRDQRKRRELRAMGWTVIEVFADDLWNEPNQREFAQHVANALHVPFTGRPERPFRALADPTIAVNARQGEHQRRACRQNDARSQPQQPHGVGITP
ncbi:hypothetical protein BG22_06930 [Bifidobacterium sp. UTBIF-78]|nr:hypothetical protein BG22_06930 [Bifidobacterium sp. UTBIF-78]